MSAKIKIWDSRVKAIVLVYNKHKSQFAQKFCPPNRWHKRGNLPSWRSQPSMSASVPADMWGFLKAHRESDHNRSFHNCLKFQPRRQINHRHHYFVSIFVSKKRFSCLHRPGFGAGGVLFRQSNSVSPSQLYQATWLLFCCCEQTLRPK